MSKNFTELTLNHETLDIFHVRKSILTALNQVLPELKGDLLDIGCGKMPYKNYILQNSRVNNYIGLDIESALIYDSIIEPDYTWDGIKMPFDNNSFNCAIGTEVLEHCPKPEIVLSEVFRILKPDGVFFFTVPFIWNLHEVPNDEYRYTPFSLKRLLNEAGFMNVQLYPTGGWHASLAQMLGLWVMRSPISKRKRLIISLLLKPVIKYLLKKDNRIGITFVEGQMISGIFGIIKK